MPPILKGIMGKLLNIPELQNLYRQICSQPASIPFWDCLLNSLGISYQVSHEDLLQIPKSGPLVVIANHPFGAVEGLVLGSLLRSVRTDVKILSNSILEPIFELQDLFICLDPFGGKDAIRRNFQPLRNDIRWLENGGVLAAFPAGEVAHFRLDCIATTDPNWKDTIPRIARKLGFSVLPVFFPGNNSLTFQILGLLHPKVRTALLAREMLNKGDRSLEVRIGRMILPERIRKFDTDSEATEYLRKKTYLLEHRDSSNRDIVEKSQYACSSTGSKAYIAPADNHDDLEAEILDLGNKNILVDQGDIFVMQASAWEIPKTLREIGRQREIAFRAIGGGSGNALDLDRFDEHYQHIFLWDKRKKEIAGAYRIGRTDHILRKAGIDGLYVSSLFRLRRSFFRKYGPALELGRSFIRRENQRDSRSLPLLWTGIARYVARHPKYRYLYGPVSISDDYRPISGQLITWFLHAKHPANPGSFNVSPLNPPSRRGPDVRVARMCIESVRHLDDLSDFISDIEPDSKGVPVLLRHYVRLGAKVLAFNIDPDFKNCLDALVMIDLAKVNIKILERLMGKRASRYFLLWHNASVFEIPDIGLSEPDINPRPAP